MATLRTADDERMVAEATLSDAVVDALGDQAEKVGLRTVPRLPGRTLVDTALEVSAQLIVLPDRGGASMLPGSLSQ